MQKKTGSERLWAHEAGGGVDRWSRVGALAKSGEQTKAAPTTRPPAHPLPPQAHPPGPPKALRVGVRRCKPLRETVRS